MQQWIDKQEYPFTSKHFEVEGCRMHYIDEGAGEPLLFVHGTPSWSFEFRNLIKAFKAAYRCIAIDHIGFGLSDKPAAYPYSTLNHSLNLEKFILEKNLTNITLVVHDFGGPIGLNFAIRNPERVKRLVVINSWLWSNAGDPDFKKLEKILRSPLLPILYKYFNFSARFLLPRSFGKSRPSKSVLKHYTKPFSKPSERAGTLAFARSLLNDQEWFDSLWAQKEVLVAKPCLLIWGMRDPALKPQLLERFLSGFPAAKYLKLDDSGHFPHEEQTAEVIGAVEAFLQSK